MRITSEISPQSTMDTYLYIIYTYIYIFIYVCYANQIQMIFQPTHLIICKLPILHAWCQNVRTDIGSFLGDIMAITVPIPGHRGKIKRFRVSTRVIVCVCMFFLDKDHDTSWEETRIDSIYSLYSWKNTSMEKATCYNR